MLKDWKAAVNSATKALECLQRLDPVSERKKGDAGGVVEEVDDATAEKIENLEKSGHTRDEVQKLRIKAYLRRAKANCEIGGWGALAAADEGSWSESSRVRFCADECLQITSSSQPCLSCRKWTGRPWIES